jgi:hypothetical protein
MPFCCLCRAIGESRAGSIPEGGGFPICAEHLAQSRERARQPAPARTVVLGSRSIEDEMLRLALSGSTLSLADFARPAGASLQRGEG